MSDVIIDLAPFPNKSLATEIKRLVLEHRIALQIISENKPLMKLYKQKIEELN